MFRPNFSFSFSLFAPPLAQLSPTWPRDRGKTGADGRPVTARGVNEGTWNKTWSEPEEETDFRTE